MNFDLVTWYAARVAAMAAFVVLSLAVLSGMAIRTGYLAGLARRRPVLQAHQFLTWLWVPLVVVHVVSLLLDGTSHIGIVDVFIPFLVNYADGSALAIGLGTCAFLCMIFISVTALMRGRMTPRTWRALHFATYPMFVLFVVHAQLAGTDFSRTAISVGGWVVGGILVALAIPAMFGIGVRAAPDPAEAASTAER